MPQQSPFRNKHPNTVGCPKEEEAESEGVETEDRNIPSKTRYPDSSPGNIVGRC